MFKSLREKLNKLKRKAKTELKAEEEKPAKPKKKKGKKKKVKKDKTQATTSDTGERVQKVRIKDKEKAVFTDGILGKRLKADKVEVLMHDLEIILLESDVALPVVEAIKKNVKKHLVGRKVRIGVDPGEVVEESLKLALRRVLKADKRINLDELVESGKKPISLMFVGVNGTGKTTSIAKVAHRYMQRGKTCVLAAGDTFRAGAIEQLTKHAEKLGIKIIKHQAGSDPAAVAYDAIEHAKARKRDLVLIDTAGRMQTNINLMDEMKKIKRVSDPDLIIFVGDSLAGNDAINQANKFDETVGIDGAILTKIDADAKGGAALSIAYAVGKPILFVGTGQEYEDLVKFSTKWMIKRLFGET